MVIVERKFLLNHYMFCHICGNKVAKNDKFCHKCGASFSHIPAQKPIDETSVTENRCDSCGKKLEGDNKFCEFCGKEVARTKQALGQTVQHVILPRHNGIIFWIKKHKKNLGFIATVVLAMVILLAIYGNYNSSKKSSSIVNRDIAVEQTVVDVICDNNEGGSGTIFTTDGIVLTNNHVIEGAKSCQITIPDPATGGISAIYEAAPVIVPKLSKAFDVATLKIDGAYTDSKGKTWGEYPRPFTPFILPKSCNPDVPSRLGDSVRIYGYPVTSGGLNLTITDGIISSFKDNGDILTSAKIDSGNSGGLAIDQNGCWLGIPSAVLSGNYQNLGVIIPGVTVETFINNVQAKIDPVAVSTSTNDLPESAQASQRTPDQQCQDAYGTFSISQTDSNGKVTCFCQNGYSWDATGNGCASQISLQQECQNSYGQGSYSIVVKGKSVCSCASGYVWNESKTQCVVIQETNDQICQDTFGVNSQWNGQKGSNNQPLCDCQPGYSWDASGKSCATQTSLDSGCQDSFGIGSYSYTQSGKAVCGCTKGYMWNSGRTSCISNYDYCTQTYANSSWDGSSYTSTGGASCTCSTGYSPNSDGTSCVSDTQY